MGLGPFDLVGLAEARELATEARKKLLRGIDPLEARRAQREALRRDETERLTFKQAADKYIALHEPRWRNPKHRQQWRNTLSGYAYPMLGTRSVTEVDAAMINK